MENKFCCDFFSRPERGGGEQQQQSVIFVSLGNKGGSFMDLAGQCVSHGRGGVHITKEILR